jgi:hypothetical protein
VGLPPSLVEFSSHCHFYKLSHSWLLGVCCCSCQPVFVYSSRGRWVFPPLLCSFPPSATLTSFPAPGCWAHAPLPPVFSQAQLVYLQFREGFPLPPFGTQGAPPSLLRVFIALIAYYSVSLFSPGWGQSVQGAMLIWPRDSVEVLHTA